MRRSLLLALAALACSPTARGQMLLEEYDPPSTLVVEEHAVPRAKYPFVDVHNHQWSMPEDELSETVAEMDALNMAVMVNLSGRGWRSGDDHLQGCLDNARENAPGRFLVFTNVDFSAVGSEGWTERAAAQLEADIRAGAAGLKIYKSLGMSVLDVDGERVPVDDARLAPLWDVCGRMGVPVLIHTGDPAPFWEPWDDQNERWLELKERPQRKRDPAVVGWEEVMAEQRRMFANHPDTTFISAHLGWMGNDLGRLGKLLDEHPNVVTEIGAVLAELGRQPRAAAAWMTKYQDRVLFGKDAWTPSEYPVYFRVLETADEYFDYYRRRHGHWKMYGLALPDEVLRKLYYGNALRLFPQLDRSLFPEEAAAPPASRR